MEKIPNNSAPKSSKNDNEEKKQKGRKVLKALRAFLAGEASEEQKRFLEEVKAEALPPELRESSTLSEFKKNEKKDEILKRGGTWHDKYDNY